MTKSNSTSGIAISAEMKPEYAAILTPAAIDFLAALARGFTERRDQLLQARQERQAAIDSGGPARLPARDIRHPQ